jgi:xylulokinase
MSLLAVDMGTSSCKAVAFSEDGLTLAQKTHSYSPESPYPSWIEMSPEKFWRALLAVTRAIAAGVTSDPVEVLAISSHGETFVPVDSHQCAIGPAILNADNRAVAEANRLAEAIGRVRLFEITGLAVHSMYPLAKMLWLRVHQPDVFSSTACFLTLPGYLLARLGLPPYVDYSLASRFLAFDIRKRTWSAEILSACKLCPEQFPTPVPAGTIAGKLAADIAGDLGLRAGTSVVVGGHDQPCAALGSGVLDAGRVSASFGTYECLVAASEAPALTEKALAANLNSYCHVVPDRYVTLAYFPSGIMIEWFLRLIHSAGELRESSVGELCATLEAHAPQGPTGLCITPHLLGTSNPDFDPNATGVIAGIRPTTSRSDLYKGILEGIACEFANMAELLQQAAGAYSGIYISGGGGRSRLGLKLRAALAGRELHLMRCPEAVCLGTAILAGIAVGKYSSFAQAVEQVVRVSETIGSDAATAQSYQAQMLQYRVLYSSLAPVRHAQPTYN